MIANEFYDYLLAGTGHMWKPLHENDMITKKSEIPSPEFVFMLLEISIMLVKIIPTDEEQFKVVGRETCQVSTGNKYNKSSSLFH